MIKHHSCRSGLEKELRERTDILQRSVKASAYVTIEQLQTYSTRLMNATSVE